MKSKKVAREAATASTRLYPSDMEIFREYCDKHKLKLPSLFHSFAMGLLEDKKNKS